MSSLRDLYVSIEFDGVGLNTLTNIDNAIDEIENNLTQMGATVNDATQELNQLGNVGSSAMNEITTESQQAENAVEDTGEAAEGAGDSFQNFKTMALGAIAAVGLAVGGLITSIGGIAAEMETAFDRLGAKTGTTGAELKELEGVARGVFNNAFGESIGEVTDNVAVMRSMFSDLNKDELQGLTEGAYTISDLWGAEVKEVGKTIKTMTATFDDLSNADAMDMITTALQKTGDYSDDLLDTFNEYSTQFKALGYDAEGFTATLIAGAESGAFNFDKLADAAKEGFLLMGEGSDDTRDALKSMGLDANQIIEGINMGGDDAQKAFMAVSTAIGTIKDPAKQAEAALAAFGTPLEDLGPQFRTFFSSVNQDLGEFQGATTAAGIAAYDNFSSRMTSAWRTMKDEMATAFAENGGAELLGAIATKAEELIPKVKDLATDAINFANSVRDNWPAIENTVVGLGVAVGSFVGIMKGLQVIGVINTLFAAWRAGTLAQTLATYGLNTALWASPMTWVVAGIAAVIAIGVLLWKNWDTVKAKAQAFWEATKIVFGLFKDMMMEKLEPVINLFSNLKTMWDNFVSAVKNFKMPDIKMPKVVSKAVDFISGSHATGLGRVPYDGYIGELHRDEAVLTAKQSNALRNAGILSGDNKPQVNLGGEARTSRKAVRGSVVAPQVNITIQGAGHSIEQLEQMARNATEAAIANVFKTLQIQEGV